MLDYNKYVKIKKNMSDEPIALQDAQPALTDAHSVITKYGQAIADSLIMVEKGKTPVLDNQFITSLKNQFIIELQKPNILSKKNYDTFIQYKNEAVSEEAMAEFKPVLSEYYKDLTLAGLKNTWNDGDPLPYIFATARFVIEVIASHNRLINRGTIHGTHNLSNVLALVSILLLNLKDEYKTTLYQYTDKIFNNNDLSPMYTNGIQTPKEEPSKYVEIPDINGLSREDIDAQFKGKIPRYVGFRSRWGWDELDIQNTDDLRNYLSWLSAEAQSYYDEIKERVDEIKKKPVKYFQRMIEESESLEAQLNSKRLFINYIYSTVDQNVFGFCPFILKNKIRYVLSRDKNNIVAKSLETKSKLDTYFTIKDNLPIEGGMKPTKKKAEPTPLGDADDAFKEKKLDAHISDEDLTLKAPTPVKFTGLYFIIAGQLVPMNASEPFEWSDLEKLTGSDDAIKQFYVALAQCTLFEEGGKADLNEISKYMPRILLSYSHYMSKRNISDTITVILQEAQNKIDIANYVIELYNGGDTEINGIQILQNQIEKYYSDCMKIVDEGGVIRENIIREYETLMYKYANDPDTIDIQKELELILKDKLNTYRRLLQNIIEKSRLILESIWSIKKLKNESDERFTDTPEDIIKDKTGLDGFLKKYKEYIKLDARRVKSEHTE